jgi:hypothetical protein
MYHPVNKQDHLACFIGGLLLLGVTEGQPMSVPDPETFTPAQADAWTLGTSGFFFIFLLWYVVKETGTLTKGERGGGWGEQGTGS